MCESGGNYGAVNPSSGAGGAYQILPSTWDLYGGQGAPQDASKAEQDRIAARNLGRLGRRRLGLRRTERLRNTSPEIARKTPGSRVVGICLAWHDRSPS